MDLVTERSSTHLVHMSFSFHAQIVRLELSANALEWATSNKMRSPKISAAEMCIVHLSSAWKLCKPEGVLKQDVFTHAPMWYLFLMSDTSGGAHACLPARLAQTRWPLPVHRWSWSARFIQQLRRTSSYELTR